MNFPFLYLYQHNLHHSHNPGIMKLGLIGYGKMGKAIESVALGRGHSICFKMDIENSNSQDYSILPTAEVIVEFTRPEAAAENIMAALKFGVPVVSGTTGWLERYQKVVDYCTRVSGSFFYASNFSPGVNLFFEMNRRLARLMDAHPEYKPGIEEIHHTNKKDAPSGTALTMIKGILDENRNMTGWSNELIPSPDKIQVTSIREGNVTGIHEVRYVSTDDLIALRHEAFSRRSFAIGAVLAAEFLVNRTGTYSMSDLLGIG
jgi:4-hydroxy-tetrahydrodipicolinate reductase